MEQGDGVISIPLCDVVSVTRRKGVFVVTVRDGAGVEEAEVRSGVRKAPSGEPEEFTEFWSVYPKRSGTNSRREALSNFRARVREGVPAAVLVTKASEYAEYVRARGIGGTEFVMQAASFLGPKRRGWETDWTPPKPEESKPGPYGIPALEGFGR